MINIWHGDSGILTPLWACRFISVRKLMNQLLFSNKSDPPAADWNALFSVSCRHWLGFRRENLSFYLGTAAVSFKKPLCEFRWKDAIFKSPEMLFNRTYHAIKICCTFSRSVRHISIIGVRSQCWYSKDKRNICGIWRSDDGIDGGAYLLERVRRADWLLTFRSHQNFSEMSVNIYKSTLL
jgi:hypothetical protein